MRKAMLLSLWFTAAGLVAQAPPPPAEIASANAKIAAKDFAGAIAVLEAFIAKTPQSPQGLALLARAHAQKGDVDAALRTYEKLMPFQGQRGNALLEMAALHLARKDEAATFTALGRLRASGSLDADVLRADQRFEALRKDARFLALLPKPADFEKPFVEKVRVIHEMRGDRKSAQFGWVARRIGDVDRDSVADFVTSAPTWASSDGSPAGRIYAYSSRSGKLLWQATGKAGEQLGLTVEAAGDVNRDTVPDVIASAPGSGHAYVYSGRDGVVLLTLAQGDQSAFISSVSTAGDLNDDGHADLLCGAPGAREGAGRAFVFSGKDGKLLLTLDGEKAGDAFGSTVAAGPLTAKARALMVGAPGAGPRRTGRVYVYKSLSTKPVFALDSDETGGAFGSMFMSVVGDVDGDQTRDLYVSDWANTAKGRSTGRIYVYSGIDGWLIHTLTGEAAGDGFGIGVADAGDLDRDGADDLVIGAWQHASGAQSGGRVYVYSGRTKALLRTITCRTPGDTFGFDTTNLGDVDGDGITDFLLTSAWSGASGYQSGRVFVIAGERKPARGLFRRR